MNHAKDEPEVSYRIQIISNINLIHNLVHAYERKFRIKVHCDLDLYRLKSLRSSPYWDGIVILTMYSNRLES